MFLGGFVQEIFKAQFSETRGSASDQQYSPQPDIVFINHQLRLDGQMGHG